MSTLKYNLGNGLFYETPHIPRDEKLILYHDLPEKEQYWRSPMAKNDPLRILSNVELRKLTEKQRIDYISTWRERWANGMWFFNNGEPTYLNSYLVDHLIFNKYNGRFLKYNESQRDDMYFREKIWYMDEIDGTCWVKPRRYGMTTEEITVCINVLIQGESHFIALQSATLDLAKKSLMTPLIETYLTRPSWMREDFRRTNGRIPRNSLELKTDVYDGDVEMLNGTVYVYPTNAKALDGKEHMYVVQDEFSKNETGANPRQIFEVNRKTIRNAGRRGKISALSTTGDSDDVLESIKEWISIVGESQYRPGQNGTISGLIKRFVSAAWSQYLPMHLLPDKYGKIDLARNEEWVNNEINKKTPGTKEYYFEKRKMPLVEDDALTSASDAAYFDKLRMVARRKFLEGLLLEEKPYVKGRLEDYVSNGVTKTKFVPDTSGPWMVRKLPLYNESRGIDNRNRFQYSPQGVYFPPVNPEGIVAYDPIRYRKDYTKSGHLSRAAIIVHQKFDYYNESGTEDYFVDRPCALYVDRPDRPEDAHYEAVKACRFWGFLLAVERQVESAVKEFDDKNMLPFVMKDPKDDIYGIWTTERVKEEGLKKLVSRYARPESPNEIDYIEDYPWEIGLIDHENFDLANSLKFDITMAEIMKETALPWLYETNKRPQHDDIIKKAILAASPRRA